MSTLMNIGKSALGAAYSKLQTTGHNIANVDTPGYSRQEVMVSTAGGQYSGSGFFGRGVEVDTVRRNFDTYVNREVANSRANYGAEEARNSQLQRLNQIFPVGEGGIGAATDNFFSALSDVASRPGDMSMRQALLARGDEVAGRMREVDAQLQTLNRSVNQDISLTVSQINQLSSQIAGLNERIAQAKGQSHTPNDLLDQRDQAIADLNQLVKTSQIEADDGSVNLFVAGGEGLVVGGKAATLGTTADPFDANNKRLTIQSGGSSHIIDEATLGGGELAGLFRFRDGDLNDARNDLGRIATVLADAINSQHRLGVDRNGNTGQDFFSVGSPTVFARSGNPSGTVLDASITGASSLTGSDYTLSYDGTNYSVRRSSDGNTSTFGALPATVDGVRFAIGSGGPMAAGDQFQIQPTRLAAQDLRVALSSPNAVAAGSPVVAETGALNAGTGSIASLGVQSANANLTQSVTITFTGAGTFDVSGTGTGNPTNVSFTPGGTISYNGWNLRLNGAPAAGDTFTVRLNPSPATNNQNAQALGSIGSQNLIEGDSLTNAYGSLLSDIGVRVRGSNSATETAQRVTTDALGQQSSISGVNLDEEAAKMLQYQQAYQAAAKVIATAQNVFDALISVIGR
jgi:flagellar hook-associated protein 1 FlgK